MKQNSIISLISALVILALSALTWQPIAAAVPTRVPQACTGRWEIQPSPDPGGESRDSRLFAVSALAPDDVWAAGYFETDAFRPLYLVEHWNGTAWTVVPTPIVGDEDNFLYGITALSTDDVWAVGFIMVKQYSEAVTLAMHWDGLQWTVIPTPNGGSVHDDLVAISGNGSNDVWAAGSSFRGSTYSYHTLVEHWNGAEWSIVPSASIGGGGGGGGGTYLSAITSSPSAMWSAGYTATNPLHTLVERPSGSRWVHVSSPNIPGHNNYLYGISAATDTDAWAAGYEDSPEMPKPNTVIEHWDGSAWSIVPSPSPAPNGNYLRGIAAVSSTEAWAAGFTIDADLATNTLVERWSGTDWTVFPSPNHQQNLSSLLAISATPAGTDLWAVGDWYDFSLKAHTFIEHYCR